MESHAETVLLIENDPDTSHLIADQALIPLGYRVESFNPATDIAQQIENLAPDVIITDPNLPGLSSKDLMVILASMGRTAPVIIIANQDQESDILQAIRVGAAGFLIRPVREAEVVDTVEKALTRSRKEREIQLRAKSLEETGIFLERQKTDFSEIFAYFRLALASKNIASFADQTASLAERLTQSDCAWLSVCDEKKSNFTLLACRDLPDEIGPGFDGLCEDELSAMVAASGQAVSIHGALLKRYKAFEEFGSVILSPIVSADKETCIIGVARKTDQPFDQHQQAMLELTAVFTSVALENEQRFRQVEHLLAIMQQGSVYSNIESNLKYDLLRQASLELRSPLKYLMECVDFVLERDTGALDPEQSATLNNIFDQAEILMDIADSMINYRQVETLRLESIDLNELVRNTTNRFKPIAQLGKITINLDLPDQPSLIRAYGSQVTRVFEGLLSNALKYCPSNGEVTIHIEVEEAEVILSVIDQGSGIDDHLAERVFDIKSSVFGYSPKRFGGIGISLPRIKEIISAYKGRIWIDREQENGFTIKVSFPRQPAPDA